MEMLQFRCPSFSVFLGDQSQLLVLDWANMMSSSISRWYLLATKIFDMARRSGLIGMHGPIRPV
jgi:hypothetical protein